MSKVTVLKDDEVFPPVPLFRVDVENFSKVPIPEDDF